MLAKFLDFWSKLRTKCFPSGRGVRTSAQKRGDAGERIARKWLEKELCWKCVTLNWRSGKGEIDLIMESPEGQLIFVEVRGRAARSLVGGYASITGKKRRILRRTIHAYLRQLARANLSWRFDVVEIGWRKGEEPVIRHHAVCKL